MNGHTDRSIDGKATKSVDLESSHELRKVSGLVLLSLLNSAQALQKFISQDID